MVDLLDYLVLKYPYILLLLCLYFLAASTLFSVQFLKLFFILVFVVWGRGDFTISISTVSARLCFPTSSAPTTTTATPFVVVRRV